MTTKSSVGAHFQDNICLLKEWVEKLINTQKGKGECYSPQKFSHQTKQGWHMKRVEGGVAMQISLHGGAWGWGHFHLSTFAEQRWRRKWRGKTTTTSIQKWIEWREGKWVCITTTPLPYFCWVHKIPHLFLSSQQEGWLMMIITHPFHQIFCSWVQQAQEFVIFHIQQTWIPGEDDVEGQYEEQWGTNLLAIEKQRCVGVCVCLCLLGFSNIGNPYNQTIGVCLSSLHLPTYLPTTLLCTYLPTYLPLYLPTFTNLLEITMVDNSR